MEIDQTLAKFSSLMRFRTKRCAKEHPRIRLKISPNREGRKALSTRAVRSRRPTASFLPRPVR